jgi:transketolase
MAIVGKRDAKDYRVFVMLGDGELQEGSVWEAAMAGSHHGLDNLIAIVDRNRFQGGAATEKTLALDPVDEKFASFGWSTASIDGNDMDEIVRTMDALPFTSGKPSLIVANTIKGKGVSFLENRAESHILILNREQANEALAELEVTR